jgi:glycosyltransferase involved in cell wall biosynthesis
MNVMKVSIITPSYNSALYIKNTIASVQAQTLRDWEMIIVDDGSIDNSADIIRDIAINDSRIKLIQKENGGSASARNVGLQQAKGDYIQFLDADDTIAYDKLERQVELMDQKGLDVTYTDYKLTQSDGMAHSQLMGFRLNLFKLLAGWGVFGTIPLHAFLYRHSFLTKHDIRNTSEVKEREDWDFHIKVFGAYPKIERLAQYCGAYYFLCPTGKTTNGSLTKLTNGTLKYLLYKIQKTTGYHKLLLLIRLSFEMIRLAIACFRKGIDYTQIKPTLENASTQTKILTIALLPVSIILYAYYWYRIHKTHKH